MAKIKQFTKTTTFDNMIWRLIATMY